MSRSGFFKQGPAPTTISFRRINHPTLAFVIKGHGGAIKRMHAGNFRALGFEYGANGCWYIPKSMLGADGKVGEGAGEYLKRFYNGNN